MHVILSCGPNEALFFSSAEHFLRLAFYILQHEKFLISTHMRGESQYGVFRSPSSLLTRIWIVRTPRVATQF